MKMLNCESEVYLKKNGGYRKRKKIEIKKLGML